MTHEEKLQAIIQAQVDGGYFKWNRRLTMTSLCDGPDEMNINQGDSGLPEIGCYQFSGDELHWYEDSVGIIQILLDTQGLRAAYGDHEEPWYNLKDGLESCSNRHVNVSILIMDAWHSGEGNSWKAAIDTAYELLPPKK